MNARRVAALLRELADALEEDAPPEDAPSRPRTKRVRSLTRPDRQVSDLAAAKAARVLREKGFT